MTAFLARLRKGPSIEDILVVVAALVGFVWTLSALADNTMFVHLRTGIDMVATGHVPHHDSYSSSNSGTEWVLQSWLAEWIYGVLHAVGTTRLVIIVNALILSFVASGMVRMARTGRTLATFINGTALLLLCLGQWSVRPTTFGFALFALLVATRNRSMWWTALSGVLWINMHGSWPIGILWLAGSAVGASIDDRMMARLQFKRLLVFVASVVIGGICNPVGWKLLVFPLTALQKSEVFSSIVEWKSPNFHDLWSMSGGGVLLGIAISLVILLIKRPGWRYCIPVLGLLAMSLYSQRNLTFFALALSPALGLGLGQRDVRVKQSGKWGLIEVFAIVMLVFVSIFQTVLVASNNPYDLRMYPVDGISYAKSIGYFTGDKQRVLMPDFVGCFRILRDGDQAGVFIDDRYDMYPTQFSLDVTAIARVDENTQGLLNQYKVDAVLWPKSKPLATYLTLGVQWKRVWSDKNWVFFTRA